MALEAPEGIVQYSQSGTTIPTSPYGGAARATSIPVGENAFIDTSDIYGTYYVATEYRQLTDTLVETLDLVSEGVIEGPLSGQWIKSGNLGQTGWSSVYFSGYTTPTGYSNLGWLRSVYWNQLPVLSDAGQFNFQNVSLSFSQGQANGDVLQQLTPEETTSRSIGTKLYAGDENAQVFRILNQNCKGVIVNIKIPSLSNTDSLGDIIRTTIQYQIAYRPIFSSILKVSTFNAPVQKLIFGKIMAAGGYIDSTRINFNLSSFISATSNKNVNESAGFLSDSDFIGWEVRISKVTPESQSALLANLTYIDSITELYGSLFSYPNSAIIRSTFDAKFFTEVPERGFECDLIRIQIPANYDPRARTYATNGYGTTNGYWNGAFASGKYWSNNPAWCFYDLITNPRYGLGKFVDNIDVYKFDLYNIAQYCDELVADGYGSIEPRFTCNAWIPQKEEAYKVVNDMASIFRGMVYYFNGNLNATQDAPKPSRFTFTNSNVENGDFNYSSTSKKTRQSVAVVRYNDPKNFYQPAIEYVDDLDSIRKYGVRELPIVAFGCTSRGQAIRLGKWALYSNNLETETVTFNAGLEASLLRCGDLFEVVDYNRKLKRYGGRVIQIDNTGFTGVNFTGAKITLDSTVDIQSGVQYSLSVLTPTFFYDQSQVTGLTSNDNYNIHRPMLQTVVFSGDNSIVSGGNTILNLPTGLDSANYNISGNPVWSIELGPNSVNYTGSFYFSSPSNDYYRVLNIKETDINKYELVGLSYYPQKFALIDTGLVLQQQSQPTISQSVIPASPRNLSLNAYTLNIFQNLIKYSFIVDNYANTSSYSIFTTTGNFGGAGPSVPSSNYLTTILPSNIISADFITSNTGNFTFRIYGYNSLSQNYSTGFASGVVTINSNTLPINGVIIGGLTVS